MFNPGKIRENPGGGQDIWIFKTKLIIELIEENFGNSIIFSDIDIQFFRETESIIKESLGKYDMVFQGENKFSGVNIGFMAFNCNNMVLDFWKEVLKIVEKEGEWDQKVVNNLIMENKVNWGYFPEEIWNWFLTSEWKSIALHHAVGVRSLNMKLFQMKIVRIVHSLKWLNNFDITYQYSRKIFKYYKNL